MPSQLIEMTAIWQETAFTVKHSYYSDKKVSNMRDDIAKELGKIMNQNAGLDLQYPKDFIMLDPLPTEGVSLLDMLASKYQAAYQGKCFGTTPLALFTLVHPRRVRHIH